MKHPEALHKRIVAALQKISAALPALSVALYLVAPISPGIAAEGARALSISCALIAILPPAVSPAI